MSLKFIWYILPALKKHCCFKLFLENVHKRENSVMPMDGFFPDNEADNLLVSNRLELTYSAGSDYRVTYSAALRSIGEHLHYNSKVQFNKRINLFTYSCQSLKQFGITSDIRRC
ncbi:hypothetical protein BpHYR1_027759 [Brachionus plicatilis]|uniref:Uncharacterized protein n=1 Tax=Brachionus plicatilis TaxID=10195 RepID=A0A3M7RAW1_BRAPC|nr:hypothetical protein BpHYR1_027759 [Brachionus plicatilis]